MVAERLESLLHDTNTGAHGVFLFSAERNTDRATAYSRMFAPELGVAEDPATGTKPIFSHFTNPVRDPP